MASIFKRGRWIAPDGKKCKKQTSGAKWVESRFWTIKLHLPGGRIRFAKGFTDRQASEQRGAQLEKAKARGEVDMLDLYKPHKARPLSNHVVDWIGELRQLGRDDVYIGLCDARMVRLMRDRGW